MRLFSRAEASSVASRRLGLASQRPVLPIEEAKTEAWGACVCEAH